MSTSATWPASSDIPVYCLSTFNQAGQRPHHGFDLKVVEELVEDFPFTHHPHRHDFYDLLFITEGSGTHTIDFITYEVKPCSLFFLSPGQVHSWELSRDTKGFTLFFEPEFYLINRPTEALRDLPFFHGFASDPVLYLDCQQHHNIRQILLNMQEEYQQEEQPRTYDILRAYLEVLLLKLSRFYQASQGPKPEASRYLRGLVHRFETLIDQHFAEVKAVKDYADMLHTSPKNLNKICKQAVGKTASEMIQTRVVLEAKRMLLHSDLAVAQVVDKLNFYDASYFIKFFKKATGMTPEQFRRAVQ